MNTQNNSKSSSRTTIVSIPSEKEWRKGVRVFQSENDAEKSDHDGLKLVVRDKVSGNLSREQLMNAELMAKVAMLNDLEIERALNEARQSYLLALKADLLQEARDLKAENPKAHALRIRQIKGMFKYEPMPIMMTDPHTDQLILDKDGKPQPVIGADGTPIMKMRQVREAPKPGQDEGKFIMLEDGLVTDIICEQTEVLYPGRKALDEMISVVRKALEKEIGRPLKANLAERDNTLADKFRALFPNS